MTTDPLVPRFEALLEPAPAPDWLDVRRRTGRPRRPFLLAAVAIALFVAVPAVAIAVRSGVLAWDDARPAPRKAVERFSALDRAQAKALASLRSQVPSTFDIDSANARSVPLGSGTIAYVAPLHDGGWCALYADPGDPGVYGIDYQLGATGSSERPIALGSHSNTYGTYVHGHVLADPSSSLRLELDDGTSVDVTVTWVDDPVGAGLFFVHLDPGRRPGALVLRDASGRELARDDHLGAAEKRMEELRKQAAQGHLGTTTGADAPRPGGFVVP